MNIQTSGTASSEESLVIGPSATGQAILDLPPFAEPTTEYEVTGVSGTSTVRRPSSAEPANVGTTRQSGTSAMEGWATVTATHTVPIRVSREAQPYLTKDFASLMESLLSLVLTAANRSQIAVSSIEIGLRYLRKDRRRNPYIWMEVKTGAEVHPNQALALWDAIGLDVDRWIPKLSPRAKRHFEDRVSLSVLWVESVAS